MSLSGLRKRSALSTFLIVRIVVISTIVTTALTAVQLILTYQHERRQLVSTVNAILNTSLPSITEGLWRLDKRQVDLLLDGLTQQASIDAVTLVESTGLFTSTAGSLPDGPFVEREVLITQPNPDGGPFELGSLSIRTSMRHVYAVVLQSVIWTLLSNGLKTLLVALFVYMLFHLVLIGRLRRLNHLIAGQQTGHLKEWLAAFRSSDLRLSPKKTGLNTPMLSHYGFDDEITALARQFENNAQALVDVMNQKDAALEHAREANAAKRDFLALVSHDLRTPLNSIITAGHLLAVNPSRTDGPELAEMISSSGEAALEMVSKVLSFVALTSSPVQTSPSTVALSPWLSALQKEFSDQMTSGAATIRYTIASDVPPEVTLDADRVHQILALLIENACRHGVPIDKIEGSPDRLSPCIDLNVSLAKRAPGHGAALEFRIRDDGPGFSSEQLPNLFTAFSTSEAVLQHGASGRLGLGLPICRLVAESLGGSITANNVTDGGAAITVVLPLVASSTVARDQTTPESENARITDRFAAAQDIPGQRPHPGRPAAARSSIGDLSVLVAEDDPLTRSLLEKMLKALSVTSMRTAADGQRAIQLLKEQPSDVVIMDVQMPTLDGLAAARKIMDSADITQKPAIFLVSAMFSEDLRKLACDSGAHGFHSKPLRLKQLAAMLESVPGPNGAPDDLPAACSI